ncbi:MAG: hypothetical protein COV70_03050 [Parcubacteria group bacterium CG11_big_fil_rev_8_21_14_0_20_39_22]|nr:MAG: hypothetical protein COV70_03050 [Parcubacteria group bacterium CG11_big_fil_rev_8_21_14_0_20_39_22]
MIDNVTIQKILGIEKEVLMSPDEMKSCVNVSFYPTNNINNSETLEKFSNQLKDSFIRIGVNVIPYDQVWEEVPLSKRINRLFKFLLNNLIWLIRKILMLPQKNFLVSWRAIKGRCASTQFKSGITVVCTGEVDTDSLPMQYIRNFKENSIITIVDFPDEVDENSEFHDHFNAAMSLFAYHMTNIVISVSDDKWMVYNFNASHPVFKFDEDFDKNIKEAIVPKIAAPISPHKFSDFVIDPDRFSFEDNFFKHSIFELKKGAILFEKTGLFPKGKSLDELPFRHDFHKHIGRLHLDERNGMSFGFIAFQIPTKLSKAEEISEFIDKYPHAFKDENIFEDKSSDSVFVKVSLPDREMVCKVPEVQILSLRSGASKTNFNPDSDLLILKLKNYVMHIKLPKTLKSLAGFRPSFDTKVIFAHALGNAIIAEILLAFDRQNQFADIIESQGVSISHWHGYMNPDLMPEGLAVYGAGNPHVSCSTPQSAIYALHGKLHSFYDILKKGDYENYKGDVHVEPHHGINVTYPSLVALAQYVLDNPDSTVLGNKFFYAQHN